MATLQKFKLLATQCAVAGSPTQSPSASPVIHLRRRKTLRMLLGRPQRRHGLPSREIHGGGEEEDPPKKKDAKIRRKLKDLFVSSPPPMIRDRVSEKRVNERRDREKKEEEEEQEEMEESRELGLRFLPAGNGSVGFGVGLVARRLGAGSQLRPVTSSGFRYRFLRRAWRPVLVSIPE